MVASLILALAFAQQAPTLTESGPLKIVTISEPQGKVHIYLPSDMVAGDTISGTVVPEPTGRNQAEIEKNSGVLEGLVLDIGRAKVPVKDGQFSLDVPVSLSVGDGKSQSVEVKPESLQLRPWMPMFEAPKVVQVFRPFVVSGPFDGNHTDTKVTIGGEPAPVLAESPRGAVVAPPSDPSPGSTVRVTEGTESSEFKVRIIAINLSAPSTQLVRGQSTPIKLEVMGLDGLNEPLPIRITNRTPSVIEIEGGDDQTHVIKPDDVQLGGICGFQLNIIAKQPGGFSLQADAVPIADVTLPPGFKQDPDDPKLVVPDGTELKPGDTIKPRKFQPNGVDVPSGGSGQGKWQKREEPYKKDLGGVVAWLQRISTISYRKNGNNFRGGEFVAQFKYTGEACRPGKWRQIVRSTTYVGSTVDDLKPAHEVNGQQLPHSDPNHKGDWEIDTNAAGKAAKNPDYPNQSGDEFIDSPQRGKQSLAGYYTDDPPRTKARVVREVVEFYAFWIGPDGKICKTVKWGFSVTWEIKDGDDPASKEAMDRAKVSTTFTDPTVVDPNSQEGKDAAAAYEGAMGAYR